MRYAAHDADMIVVAADAIFSSSIVLRFDRYRMLNLKAVLE